MQNMENHIPRKQDNYLAKQTLDWNPNGKKSRDRPRNTCRRSIDEMTAIGMTCVEVNKAAKTKED